MAQSRSRGNSAASRRRSSHKSSGSKINPTLIWIGAGVAIGGLSALAFMMLRPKVAYAPETDYLPDDPTIDRFGNTGDDNMVAPLSLKEDKILMRDRLNPRNGLI